MFIPKWQRMKMEKALVVATNQLRMLFSLRLAVMLNQVAVAQRVQATQIVQLAKEEMKNREMKLLAVPFSQTRTHL
jgi:hypothetical protein